MSAEQATAGSISKIGVAVFPGFELLDTFGPLEALFTLSFDHKIDLYVIATTLDTVYSGTSNPLMNKKGSRFGVTVVPTHTHETVPDDLEVLLIPGGIGVMEETAGPTVEFVKKTYPKLKYLITVCNGASVAATAGVLDGKRATTNKAAWKIATAAGPNVNWVKTARYVVDGNCWTSAGVSAGIDVTLAWISKIFGEEKARFVANGMEYEWRDDPNWDPFAYMFGEGEFLSS
ncbi:class I glutamine amidotransferase-like protein [Ganoderma leucocontextum]|nr:class I glutamine amidotransferase-like protein [Ganoderma leucocontextum]